MKFKNELHLGLTASLLALLALAFSGCAKKNEEFQLRQLTYRNGVRATEIKDYEGYTVVIKEGYVIVQGPDGYKTIFPIDQIHSLDVK